MNIPDLLQPTWLNLNPTQPSLSSPAYRQFFVWLDTTNISSDSNPSTDHTPMVYNFIHKNSTEFEPSDNRVYSFHLSLPSEDRLSS